MWPFCDSARTHEGYGTRLLTVKKTSTSRDLKDDILSASVAAFCLLDFKNIAQTSSLNVQATSNFGTRRKFHTKLKTYNSGCSNYMTSLLNDTSYDREGRRRHRSHRYHPNNCVDRLRKPTEPFSYDSKSADQYPNPKPLKCHAGLLITQAATFSKKN